MLNRTTTWMLMLAALAAANCGDDTTPHEEGTEGGEMPPDEASPTDTSTDPTMSIDQTTDTGSSEGTEGDTAPPADEGGGGEPE